MKETSISLVSNHPKPDSTIGTDISHRSNRYLQ